MELKPENELKITKLSSSRLELLENCSWSYHARYHLRLPQGTNPGQLRGNCVHSVLEFLATKKRFTWVDEILKVNDLYLKPSIKRYVKIYLRKWKLGDEDEELIRSMTLVALNHDFFFKDLPNSEMLETEHRFDITSDNPRYSITGFMDRSVIYDDNKIVARDFKTSKKKYAMDYLHGATQGFMYSLVLKKMFPTREPSVEFLFLRFPKKPVQTFSPDEKALRGFEYYLEEATKFLQDFNDDKARGNFAKDNPDKRWLCGREGTSFICEARKPLDYFVIIENNKIVKGANTKEELELILKPNQTIEPKHYPGCPAWYKQKPKFRHPDESF